MRTDAFTTLATLASFLTPTLADAQAYALTMKAGEPVVKLKEGEHFTPGAKRIPFEYPGAGFDADFYCKEGSGKELTAAADGVTIGCCLPGQVLVGSEDTQYLCCGKDHIMAGNKDVGFSCCPKDEIFDGKVCKPSQTCSNGKSLVNGKCVCPPGTNELEDGSCKTKDDSCKPPQTCSNGKTMVNGKCVCPPGTNEQEDGSCGTKDDSHKDKECSMDLSYGKCYKIRLHNGEFFGADIFGIYYAKPPAINNGVGVFNFCKDETCKSSGPIGSNDTFYIKDLRGVPNNGDRPGEFLNNAINGGHVGRTTTKASFGEFSIAKYIECGKYCLGGGKWGLSYACPSATPAWTFWQNDPGSCVVVEIVEVPCDYRSEKNNCLWDKNCDGHKQANLAASEL